LFRYFLRPPTGIVEGRREAGMELSARNQLSGTVKSLKLGAIMSEVVVDVGGQEVVAAITRGSAERLGLEEGTHVTAVIKATDVLIGTPS
jgi:molybdopterin-binding protein